MANVQFGNVVKRIFVIVIVRGESASDQVGFVPDKLRIKENCFLSVLEDIKQLGYLRVMPGFFVICIDSSVTVESVFVEPGFHGSRPITPLRFTKDLFLSE